MQSAMLLFFIQYLRKTFISKQIIIKFYVILLGVHIMTPIP